MPFIGNQTSANSKVVKYTYTATANQQDFNTIVDSGDTVSVYLNGVLLKETTDYTYTVTTVSLVAGASAGDIVEIHVFVSMVLADAVRASGDTMTGDLETTALKTNTIKGADNSNKITFDASPDTTLVGDLIVGGNVIQASDGGNTITLDTSDNVTIAGDLKVGAVKASDGTAGISIADSTGRLTVTENNPVITLGSNATFSNTKVTDRMEFYHSVKNSSAPEGYGQYAVAGNTENSYAFCSGVAPTGYTSIVDMYWWFITTNGGTQTYQAEFAWSIAGDGQNYEVHTRGDTSFFSGASYAQNTMVKKSLMNNGSPTFESTIASGDAFGLKIKHNVNLSIVSLGVSITWRF